MEVGDVVQFYDSDRQFPAWGFGGNVAGGHSSSVSHCFNLNGTPNECEVWGIKIKKSIIYYSLDLFILRWLWFSRSLVWKGSWLHIQLHSPMSVFPARPCSVPSLILLQILLLVPFPLTTVTSTLSCLS